jgi:hypothetical protein
LSTVASQPHDAGAAAAAVEPLQAWWRQFTRQHWMVFWLASLAWLFDCLDQQVFNLARDGALEDLLVNKTRANEIAPYTTSVFLVGWAIGGLIFGALNVYDPDGTRVELMEPNTVDGQAAPPSTAPAPHPTTRQAAR